MSADLCARCGKPGAGYADRFEVLAGKKTASLLYHRACLPSGPSVKPSPSAATPPKGKSPNKYRNEKTTVDNIVFDSKKEAGRYVILRASERAGAIHNLTRQVRVPVHVNGELICHWIADFRYLDVKSGALVYEDVKSEHTRKLPVYRLKKKLVAACCGIEILET